MAFDTDTPDLFDWITPPSVSAGTITGQRRHRATSLGHTDSGLFMSADPAKTLLPTDFRDNELRNALLKRPELLDWGLYCIKNAFGQIMYIGQSKDGSKGIGARLARHICYTKADLEGQRRVFSEEMASVSLLPFPRGDDQSAFFGDMEKFYVHKFQKENHPVMQCFSNQSEYTYDFEFGEEFPLLTPETLLVERDVSVFAHRQTYFLSEAQIQLNRQPSPTMQHCVATRYRMVEVAMRAQFRLNSKK